MYGNKRKSVWFENARTFSSLICMMDTKDLKKMKWCLSYLRKRKKAIIMLSFDNNKNLLFEFNRRGDLSELNIEFLNNHDIVEGFIVISDDDPIAIFENIINIALFSNCYDKRARIKEIFSEYVTDCMIY